MNLIHCALRSEAQPLIEHYNLKQDSDSTHYPLFKGEGYSLIIGGIGKVNTASALGYVLSKLDILDRIFNIGICGATTVHPIQELIVPTKVVDLATGRSYFPEPALKGPFLEGTIGTSDTPVSAAVPQIDFYDMEASAFFEVAAKFLPPSRIHIIKIISDNLTFENITREFISKLIYTRLSTVTEYLEATGELSVIPRHKLTADQINSLSQLAQSSRLTVAQYHKLLSAVTDLKSRGGDIVDFLNFFRSDAQARNLTKTTKRERNEWFRTVEEHLSTK